MPELTTAPVMANASVPGTTAPTVQPPFKSPDEPLFFKANTGTKTTSQIVLLPTLFQDENNELHRTEGNLPAYLKHALTMPRLQSIDWWLGWAGRPMAARALHRQIMMCRTITITEQIDMHLLWIASTIFIKPLPRYLMSHDFWSQNLVGDAALHAAASGFLLSYTWLVQHESDLKIATESGLLPSELSWGEWVKFTDAITKTIDVDGLTTVDPRYKYGELRLSRINWIYRLAPHFYLKHFVRGYFYMYHEYGTFFQRNFTWILSLFAYLSIALSALQLGLATKQLPKQQLFQNASYWFTIFALLLPFAVVALMLLLYVSLVLYNIIVTILFRATQRSKRGKSGTVKAKASP